MENKGNFRKALFGFNTKDVMEYIAMLHNDFYSYRQESEKQIYELQRRIDELENEESGRETVERVFGPEHEELLSELQEQNDSSAEKINEAADRLESLIANIEELISK